MELLLKKWNEHFKTYLCCLQQDKRSNLFSQSNDASYKRKLDLRDKCLPNALTGKGDGIFFAARAILVSPRNDASYDITFSKCM